MGKFRGKYRIESNRLKGWDYAGDGKYFITVITQNRTCNLGKIKNGIMILSDYGAIVKIEWLKSFEIRTELILDEYIIMPNHLHAILILDKSKNDPSVVVVETHGRASLRRRPQRPPQSISSFFGGFKSAINSKIDDYIDANKLNIPKYNRNNHFFQPNYHDHVIRNDEEYKRIKNYIINNPSNWDGDSLR